MLKRSRRGGPYRAGGIIRRLREGAPGSRFRDYHRSHAPPSRRSVRLGVCAAGAVLALAGLATYPIPGPPSTLMVVLGAALLARGSERGAAAMDRLEIRLRRALRRGPGTLPVVLPLVLAAGHWATAR